jgi:hypothetical protein
VLDVDLLGAVAREGKTSVSDDACREVRLDILAIQVLLRAVTRAEVENEGADLDALRTLPGSFLPVCAERGYRSAHGTALETHPYRYQDQP